MRFLNNWKVLAGALALASALACTEQPAANTNTAAPNVNASPATASNANMPATDASARIDVREPNTYRATYVLMGQTTGSQAAAASFNVEVARNGNDRRYAFDTRFPGVGKVVFLDKADKRYLILEGRKQYMELTPETTGVQVPRAMTPGMMIEQLQNQQGVTKVGEENLGGRTAVKYRYAGTTNTGTQAGQARGETFVYVDKETGLPLKVEAAGATTGNVQGVTGGTATMEMRDISTTVEPALFELPQGYSQVTAEQVQQTAKILLGALQALAGSMGGGTGATASPSATPAPGGSPMTP